MAKAPSSTGLTTKPGALPMPISKILVPVRDDGQGENNLAFAAAVARAHSAHIEILHCRARPSDMIPYGVVVPLALREQIKENAKALADSNQHHMVAEFDKLLGELAITRTDAASVSGPTASWHEEEGKMAELIGLWGRLADLIVVARPQRKRNMGLRTLMAALYDCGRPVLMCPPNEEHPKEVGQRVAIAWNGSLEATRAVAMSLDLLANSKEVAILAGGSNHAANSADQLRQYLKLKGIAAEIESLDARRNPGKRILDAATAAGSDLIVMGAYSHSRERELVFGGATQQVVDHAHLPVVFAH